MLKNEELRWHSIFSNNPAQHLNCMRTSLQDAKNSFIGKYLGKVSTESCRFKENKLVNSYGMMQRSAVTLMNAQNKERNSKNFLKTDDTIIKICSEISSKGFTCPVPLCYTMYQA